MYKRRTDAHIIEIYRRAIKPGTTVVDIGSNVGFYAALFSHLVGERGKVICFEPDPINFSHLRETTRNFANVSLHNLAIGENNCRLKLFLSEKMNVDHRTYDAGDGRPAIEVDCVALDSFFPKEQSIDALKIDIQGFDYYAVRGMKETLHRCPRLTMVGEFWPFGLQKAGVQPREYLAFVRELGFKVVLLGEEDEAAWLGRTSDESAYTDFVATK